MKNWFKKAKMEDFTSNEEVPTHKYCERCKKWATQDETGNVIWKPYYQMDIAEQREMDKAYKAFQTGQSKVTSEVCPTCMDMIGKR